MSYIRMLANLVHANELVAIKNCAPVEESSSNALHFIARGYQRVHDTVSIFVESNIGRFQFHEGFHSFSTEQSCD